MNCEICGEQFSRLKDVIRHGTGDMHKYTHFYCIPCALSLPDVTDVIEHIASKEHPITALATGIRFDVVDEPCSGFVSASFPTHNCCFLCSNRDGTLNNIHIKTSQHQYMAWLLRTIIRSKKIYCSDRNATFPTQEFISKLINARLGEPFVGRKYGKSLRFACDLCNLHFNTEEPYERHLKDESHLRMELFMAKISRIARRLEIVGAGPYTYDRKTFSNSFRPLYYCEVCDRWIDTVFNYAQHRKSYKHISVEYLWKRAIRRKMGDSVMSSVVSSRAIHHCSNIKYETYRHPFASKEPFLRKGPLKRKMDDDTIGNVDPAGLVHCYPKLKSKRYRKNSDQYLLEYDDESDSCNENVPKKLKTSSPPYCHQTSVGDKHHEEIISEILSQENGSGNHIRACGTICAPSIELDSSESRRDSTQRELETGPTAENSPQLELETEPTTRNSPRRELETEETAKNYPERELKEDETTGNSDLKTGSKSDLQLVSVASEAVGSSEPDPEEREADFDQEHYCELCDFLCYNALHYGKHLMGDQHRRMRKLINKKNDCTDAGECGASNVHPLQYKCELCEVVNFNFEEYDFHLNSVMHRKNQWLLYVLKQRPL